MPQLDTRGVGSLLEKGGGVSNPLGGIGKGLLSGLVQFGKTISRPEIIKSTAQMGAALSAKGSQGERLGTVTSKLATDQAFQSTISKMLAGEDLEDITEARALDPVQITNLLKTSEDITKRKFSELTEVQKLLKALPNLGLSSSEASIMRTQIIDTLGHKGKLVSAEEGRAVADISRAGSESRRVDILGEATQDVETQTTEAEKDRVLRMDIADTNLRGVKIVDDTTFTLGLMKLKAVGGNKFYKGIALSTHLELAKNYRFPGKYLAEQGVPIPEGMESITNVSYLEALSARDPFGGIPGANPLDPSIGAEGRVRAKESFKDYR